MTIDELRATIRQVPDFPKPGINFYDVATLFRNGNAFHAAVEHMAEHVLECDAQVVAGIEARGFVLGAAVAHRLGLGLVMVRKFGKLPGETEGEAYALEYGKGHLEVQSDSILEGTRVVVLDDLLATGGTAAASCRVLERLGGEVVSVDFLVELEFLNGREALADRDIFSVIRYA